MHRSAHGLCGGREQLETIETVCTSRCGVPVAGCLQLGMTVTSLKRRTGLTGNVAEGVGWIYLLHGPVPRQPYDVGFIEVHVPVTATSP